jgi:hypothetical protein
MREHAAVAVLKPREEVMGRGGPAQLVLREGGWGSDAHGAEEDGAQRPTAAQARQRRRPVGYLLCEAWE